MRAAVLAAVVLASAGLLAGCGTRHSPRALTLTGHQIIPEWSPPTSSMERHWFGRVGLTLSARAATGIRADRRTKSIRRAVQEPGIHIVSLTIYPTPKLASPQAPALYLEVSRPAYSLRHQLKAVLPLLTENRSAYYLRVVDARSKRVLESYWSPERGAAIQAEGSIYVRPGLISCSPIAASEGMVTMPPCLSK